VSTSWSLLAECTFEEAAKLARDPRVVIVLPLGAIEEHGPHLPLLVDWLGAEELARMIAPYLRRAGWRPVLAPSIPYGVSPLAEDWSGTVSLTIGTLRRMVCEVIQGLARHGFRRFVLANYQADPGHLRAMALIKRNVERWDRVQVLFAGFTPGRPNPSMLSPRVAALLRSPRPDREWHSGELETAMMLAVRPRLVRRALARKLPPVWVDVKGALAAGPTTFRKMNPKGRGYFGWPPAARAETGRAAFKLRARLISQDLITELRKWR
jgi:creatinine amidohydrolase